MDERSRVREALAELLADGGWPAPSAAIGLNRLLDACGSDARPLATLLVLHADLTEQLLAASAGAAWSARREQGARVLAQRGLGFDDAAWVLECWAYARGLIGAHDVQRARAHAAPPAALPVARPTARSLPYATGPGGKPVARWRGGTPVSALPRWSRTDKLAGALLGTLFVAVAGFAWRGIGDTARERAAAMPAVAGAVTAEGTARGAADRAGPVGVGAAVGGAPAPAAALATLEAPPSVTASGAVTASRPGPAALPLPDDPRFAPPLISRGVGGRYVVWRALVEVSGDEGCEQLDRSIDWRAPTEEVIAHEPGRTAFAFASRPSVRGHLGWDGVFTVDPTVGSTDGGSYRFSMRGRFTDGGFEAQSETVSRVLIKYRTWRSCRVVATLRGVRRDDEAPRP
jgi:hypothetical protein